jgi:hypothetical protein
MQTICVYCGSNFGDRSEYREAATALGAELGRRGLGLVYGGGAVGLMGAVADAALAAGARVVGVIPQALSSKEIAHQGLSELHVVPSMHERKLRMANLADAFVALPGGYGTFEEFFEVITWAQLGFHAKPTALLNVLGYYDGLLQFLDHAVASRFLKRENRELFFVETRVAGLLDRLAVFQPPRVKKWIGPDQT